MPGRKFRLGAGRIAVGLNGAPRRGFDLLDRLDEIRMGLLMGTIPTDRLNNLLRLVRGSRDGAMDPKLNAILDDIELRAMVELAKLGRYP